MSGHVWVLHQNIRPKYLTKKLIDKFSDDKGSWKKNIKSRLWMCIKCNILYWNNCKPHNTQLSRRGSLFLQCREVIVSNIQES